MVSEDQNEQTAIEVYEAPIHVAVVDDDPTAQVEMGQRQAKALMSILENNKDATLFAIINKKKYLRVEGWQLIGKFNRISAVPEYVNPIPEDDDSKQGYEAKVNLYQDGNIIGSGIMICGLDDWVCQGKAGLARDNACMSMAQTRATSKAYRLNFSWIAVLAGFQPTPAEEMQGQQPNNATSDFMCTIHRGKKWFQSAKMKQAGRGHAHPTDGGGWCNMADVKADQEVTSERRAGEKPQAVQEEVGEQAVMGEYMAEDDALYQQHLNEMAQDNDAPDPEEPGA